MLKKLKRFGLVLISIIFTNTISIAEETSKNPLYEVTLAREVERARKTIRMIDDMYKTFIVLITKEYVKDSTIFSAATLTKRVFEAMSKKGWHEARLLSTSDTPLNPDNSPKDGYERDAIKAIVSGKNYYEKFVRVDGKYYLMAVTSVRAVTEGCTICHPGTKVGDLLGAISYRISLDKYFE